MQVPSKAVVTITAVFFLTVKFFNFFGVFLTVKKIGFPFNLKGKSFF